MKPINFVITIKDNPLSVASADRCIATAKRFGVEVEYFNAYTPTNSNISQEMKLENIPEAGFIEKYSRKDNCMSAFLSHYTLWKRAAELNVEVTIFEHDAVIVNNIPDNLRYQGCINLGAPSYGRFNTPTALGVGPLVSKPYFPGAHAYRVNPAAAKSLIAAAKVMGRPTDVFLNRGTFAWLEEYYPWPVEARDSFTTIQTQTGCLAKHNYSDRYEII
jgi:GR25 family glycosyltransferase involved in LPS biosynthesis